MHGRKYRQGSFQHFLALSICKKHYAVIIVASIKFFGASHLVMAIAPGKQGFLPSTRPIKIFCNNLIFLTFLAASWLPNLYCAYLVALIALTLDGKFG